MSITCPLTNHQWAPQRARALSLGEAPSMQTVSHAQYLRDISSIKASAGLGPTHTTEAKKDMCTVPGCFCQFFCLFRCILNTRAYIQTAHGWSAERDQAGPVCRPHPRQLPEEDPSPARRRGQASGKCGGGSAPRPALNMRAPGTQLGGHSSFGNTGEVH